MRRAVRRGLSELLKRPATAWANLSMLSSFVSTCARTGAPEKKPSMVMAVREKEALLAVDGDEQTDCV